MSTTPTNLPVPSEKPQDLKFNAGKIDEFVTSMAKQYIDRFGHAHYTIEGLRWVAQQAIAAFGYITLDSFEDGNTLTLPNQVLRLEATGEYYRWDGVFPKDVPAGSTPDSTGGIGTGAWLSVGDATLRSDLSKNTGAGLSGTSSGNTVQEELDKIKLKFNSFAEMRSSTELAIGDYALLTGWHADHQGYGAGVFKCVDKTGLTDDGGTIAVAATYAWLRITGPGDATEFGVVPNAGSSFDNRTYILSAANSGVLKLPSGDIHATGFSISNTKYVGSCGLTKLTQIAGDTSTYFITHASSDGAWSGRVDGIIWENIDIYPLDTSIGLYSYYTTQVKMRNVKVFGGAENMRIEGIASWYVDSCEFRESKGNGRGVYISPKVDAPVGTLGTWVIFHKCFFASAVKHNVELVSLPSVWFRDCIFASAGDLGILARKDATAFPGVEFTVLKISGCDIDANASSGIWAVGSVYPDISNNWVSSGRTNTSPGITLIDCFNIKVTENECQDNGTHGIAIQKCQFGTISNNICNDNRATGIRIESDSGVSNRITVSGNTCCGTPFNAYPNPQSEGIHIEGDRIVSYGNICLGNQTSQYQNNASNKQEGLNIVS